MSTVNNYNTFLSTRRAYKSHDSERSARFCTGFCFRWIFGCSGRAAVGGRAVWHEREFGQSALRERVEPVRQPKRVQRCPVQVCGTSSGPLRYCTDKYCTLQAQNSVQPRLHMLQLALATVLPLGFAGDNLCFYMLNTAISLLIMLDTYFSFAINIFCGDSY